jgi:hypothetical protein
LPSDGDICVARNLDATETDRPLDEAAPPEPPEPAEIRFRCVNCRVLLKVSIDWIGESVCCPRCDTRMIVLKTMDLDLVVDCDDEPEYAIVPETRKPAVERRKRLPKEKVRVPRVKAPVRSIRRSSQSSWLKIVGLVVLLALGLTAYRYRHAILRGAIAGETLPRQNLGPDPRRVDLWVERVPSPVSVPKASAEDDDKRFQQRLAFHRRMLGEAYDRVGKKNARWDGPAKQALELAARHRSGAYGRINRESIGAAAKQALHQGCDDPLILLIEADATDSKKEGQGIADLERTTRIAGGAIGVIRGDYPACCKIDACRLWVGSLTIGMHRVGRDDPRSRKARELLDFALALVPRQVEELGDFAETPDGRDLRVRTLEWIDSSHRLFTGDEVATLAWLEKGIKDIPGGPADMLLMKGRFRLTNAWLTRADSVFMSRSSRSGLLEDRSRYAVETLEEAWKLDPNQVETALARMSATRNLNGDRATMTTWFDRAMAAHPGHCPSCAEMLDYLDPRWYGTEEEMLAFGRECAASGQWESNTPLLVIEAHCRLMKVLSPNERERYFKNDDVWNDLRSVFEELLARRPYDRLHESHFAYFCHLCGHDDLATLHFRRTDKAYLMGHFDNGRVQAVREQLLRLK